MTDLNIKYSELLPYLEQVDQIDSSVERSGKRSQCQVINKRDFQTRAGGLQAGCLQQKTGTEIQNSGEKAKLSEVMECCIYDNLMNFNKSFCGIIWAFCRNSGHSHSSFSCYLVTPRYQPTGPRKVKFAVTWESCLDLSISDSHWRREPVLWALIGCPELCLSLCSTQQQMYVLVRIAAWNLSIDFRFLVLKWVAFLVNIQHEVLEDNVFIF